MRDFLIGMLGLALVGCGGVSMRDNPGEEASGLGCAGECSGATCAGLPAVEWSELGGGRLILRGEGVSGVRMTVIPGDPGSHVAIWSCPQSSSERDGVAWTLELSEPLRAGSSLEVVINEWVGASVVVPLRPSEVEPL